MLRIAVTLPMEFYPFVNLHEYVLARMAVGWVERGIVAVSAASAPHPAVAVRTGETGIDYHLLQPLPIFFLEISCKRIVTFHSCKITNC